MATDQQRRATARRPSPVILAIRATPVNLRLDAPYRWVAGLNYGFTNVIVEIETDAGIVGLGEAGTWRHAQLISDDLAPRLIGRPVDDLHGCWDAAVPPVETMPAIEGFDVVRAFGAIEMALWDVRARASEMPLHRLLGGAVRTRVPFTEYFAPRPRVHDSGGEESPQEIAAYCERMVSEFGSPYFEGKVGYSDLDTDIELATLVREAIGPHRSLALDANMGWSLTTARRALQRLAALDIVNVEDPTTGLEAMARLREHSVIPFSTHGSDVAAAMRLRVPDRFVLNLTALGGIERTLRFVAACDALGIDFSFYSGETGVGTAAYLQVAAAERSLRTPSQSLVRWYQTDVIADGPFVPVEGHLTVPEGDGLGVELDREALRGASRDFQTNGPLEQTAIDPIRGYHAHPPLY
jgi:glucarate dehydratase